MLVRLPVASILIEHVGCASLDLRLNNLCPKPLSLDALSPTTFSLISSVKSFELFTPGLSESRALIGAHQGPFFVLLYPLHEEIGDPEGIEEVTGSIFLLTMVLPELKVVIDVSVPRLNIYSKCTSPLAAALVNIASCVIEDLKHRDQAV